MKQAHPVFVAAALCATALPAPASATQDLVQDYRVQFGECRQPGGDRPLAALRSFRRGGEQRILAVDPETLDTVQLPERGARVHRLSWKKLRKRFAATPYGKALADSEKSAAVRQDAGLVHTLPTGRGVVLTIDLCPSPRPLDRMLFTSILAEFEPEEKPVPLGIAVTGRWMLAHPKDLTWLRELEAGREITVTWINHSFNHRYDKDLPLARNFLLESGTDVEAEVLRTEAAMIENGLSPSIFFRFPGLVSGPALVGRVLSYGLIPVGSDAWLAKNQSPSPGSIVLVHGNGNEPLGIERFRELLRREQGEIREKHWLLFDLRESVAREEGEELPTPP